MQVGPTSAVIPGPTNADTDTLARANRGPGTAPLSRRTSSIDEVMRGAAPVEHEARDIDPAIIDWDGLTAPGSDRWTDG